MYEKRLIKSLGKIVSDLFELCCHIKTLGNTTPIDLCRNNAIDPRRSKNLPLDVDSSYCTIDFTSGLVSVRAEPAGKVPPLLLRYNLKGRRCQDNHKQGRLLATLALLMSMGDSGPLPLIKCLRVSLFYIKNNRSL